MNTSLKSAVVRRRSLIFGIALVLVWAVLAMSSARGVAAQNAAAARNADERPIDFNWDVRPILADNCFRCHGQSETSRQAGLRLDQADTAYAELRNKPGRHAIVPGKPDESDLIRRITAPTPGARMPPPLANKVLTEAQVATLKKWIEQGAVYKPHWAFITPQKPAVLALKSAGRGVNEIDRFVLARLEREGVSPSKEADKETLINRVTLTLTGLPPTLEDVDAFVRDTSPNAYEKLVNRLLASPAYGEHMFSFWADLARWAESDGFLDDHHDRLLWPWRDWVIGAFNRNMPFNQFGTWQLAGDLLPNPTKEQRLATTFLRVGKRTTENGAIDEEYRVEYMVDRSDTVGTAFLGLTVGCARCHDHKYDPISHKDYYSMAGFYNNADEPGFYAPGFSGIQGGPTLPWPSHEQEQKLTEARAQIKTRLTAYQTARAAAEGEAPAKVASLMTKSPAAIAADVQASIQRATAAYYPFDEQAPLDDARIPAPPPVEPLPAELAAIRGPQILGRGFVAAAAGAAQPEATPGRGRGGTPGGTDVAGRRGEAAPRAPQGAAPSTPGANAAGVPGAGGGFGGLFGAQGMGSGLIRDESVLSPSGLPGGPPAVLQGPKFDSGVKGQALFFTDTNKGVIRNVGAYDRTKAFSIDFWFYPGQRYEFKPEDVYQSVPVLNHKNGGAGGNVGYRLQLEDGYLWLNLAHSTPAAMIALKTRDPLPVKEWTHVTVTYDGSSRAAGTRIFLNGRRAEVDVDHDTLEGAGTMLPRSYMGGDFLGVMFGTRFREKAPTDSGIDELRFFDKELTPVEVSYLQNPDTIVRASADVLKTQLTDFVVASDARVVAAHKMLDEAREVENEILTRIPQVLVMGETPKPRQAYRLDRGLYNQPREELPVQALNRIFPWNEQQPRNRIGLANWLFDPKNPLTARVFVNRLWQMHFGPGLVQTAEDFGTQGAIPTHPELLDWLAVSFVESGWNVKQLHKMIVMSATYRESSDATSDLLHRDPGNLLLARHSRPRMSAEVLRDTALAVSTLLVQKVGGPSVFPYQPSDIWNGLNTNYRYPAPETLPAEHQHRRSLYTFIKRNAEHPGMQIFDFSDRSLSKARRQTSNTPLQALEMLNDPQFAEAYRVLATRVIQAGGPVDAQIERLFRLATRRRPRAEETALLRSYYETQRSEFAADRKRATQMLAVGVTPVEATIDPVTLASMSRVAALAMNTPDAYSIR